MKLDDLKYFRKLVVIILSIATVNIVTVNAQTADSDSTGKVIEVRGANIFIEFSTGPAPKSGDQVEINYDVSGKMVKIGNWRVSRVMGPVTEAVEITADIPPEKGMTAVIHRTGPVAGVGPKPEIIPNKKPAIANRIDSQPVSAPAAAGIQTIKTASYNLVWTDRGSGARQDFATYRPAGQQGYYPLGDVAVTEPWNHGRYAAPDFSSILVKDGSLQLAKPVTYVMTWSSRGSGSDLPFSTWKPVAPPGYQCLGEVGITSLDVMPSTDIIRCLPDQCVLQIHLEDHIWTDHGSGANQDFSAWSIPGLTTYIGFSSHKQLQRTAYTINSDCME